MATLLVVGGSGLLGSKLVALAARSYDVVATYRTSFPQVKGIHWVRLQKEDQGTEAVVRETDPDYVVDTAAFHNVDRCEEDRELAWRVNVDGTSRLCRAAQRSGARYLYVSTDFVFDGSGGPYREVDEARPVNYYGTTKLEAEGVVLEADQANQVVRPSVVYGWNESRLNFATWVLTTLREGKEVRAVTDWWGSPTLADSLADSILSLLQVHEGGVFHLAGPDCMSRYDFALRLAAAFDLHVGLVRPVRAAELGMKAPRPANSCLVNERAAARGITVVGVEEGLAMMKSQQSLESFETPSRFKS